MDESVMYIWSALDGTISKNTYYKYKNEYKKHAKILAKFEAIEDKLEQRIVEALLSGAVNHSFGMFMLRSLYNWQDKAEDNTERKEYILKWIEERQLPQGNIEDWKFIEEEKPEKKKHSMEPKKHLKKKEVQEIIQKRFIQHINKSSESAPLSENSEKE